MQHSTEGRPSWKEFSKLMFCLNFSTIDASEWIISGLPLTITVCWILNYLMSTSILKQEFIWGGIQIGLIIILCWVCMLKQSISCFLICRRGQVWIPTEAHGHCTPGFLLVLLLTMLQWALKWFCHFIRINVDGEYSSDIHHKLVRPGLKCHFKHKSPVCCNIRTDLCLNFLSFSSKWGYPVFVGLG